MLIQVCEWVFRFLAVGCWQFGSLVLVCVCGFVVSDGCLYVVFPGAGSYWLVVLGLWLSFA